MTTTVIDLHHERPYVVADILAAKITAVIHKGSQGTYFKDPEYHNRRPPTMAGGVLWGAYHFATGDSPGDKQADFFLDTIIGEDGVSLDKTLLCLDLEANPDGPSMGLYEAEQFARRIQERVGRLPVLYTGKWVLDALGWRGVGYISQMKLWDASYNNRRPDTPSGWSDNYYLWQCTDGELGKEPFRVPIPDTDRELPGYDRSETTLPDDQFANSFGT